jgi:hypothetical protein
VRAGEARLRGGGACAWSRIASASSPRKRCVAGFNNGRR